MDNVTVLDRWTEGYDKFMAEHADPRTKDWFLMSSPWPLACLLLVYVWGCLSAGPRIMKNREPFQLKTVLIVYNFLQMIGSAWLFYEGLEAGWLRDYSYTCQPIDYSNNPQAIRMAGAVWWYFMFKIVELLDTVFFVLRKKNSQMSFLHMYHHSMMPVCGWIGTRFLAGGHGSFLGLINCLVHVVMYCYYMIAAMGPKYQRYLGWKSWVTLMQMVQFVIVFAHQSQVLFTSCNYPKSIAALLTLNAALFLYMFGSFYYQTYVLGPSRKAGHIKKAASNGHGLLLTNNNNVVTKDNNGKFKDN